MRIYRLRWEGVCSRYTPLLGDAVRRVVEAYPGFSWALGRPEGMPWSVETDGNRIVITVLAQFEQGPSELRNVIRWALPWEGQLYTYEDDLGVA